MDLKQCETREQVEECLAPLSFNEREKRLLEAMGNPLMSYTHRNLTDEQKYEMCLASFLSGGWKYGEMLRSHGL